MTHAIYAIIRSLEDSPTGHDSRFFILRPTFTAKFKRESIGSEGAEWERDRKNLQFSANKLSYHRNGARRTGSRFLRRTSTKSHMRFRLVPKLSTLDDLERQNSARVGDSNTEPGDHKSDARTTALPSHYTPSPRLRALSCVRTT